MVLSLIIILQLIAITCFVVLSFKNKTKSEHNSSVLKERLDILTKKLEFYNDGNISNLTKTTIAGENFWKVTNNINYEFFYFRTPYGSSLNSMSTFQFVDVCEKIILWLKDQIESNTITLNKMKQLNMEVIKNE